MLADHELEGSSILVIKGIWILRRAIEMAIENAIQIRASVSLYLSITSLFHYQV